MKTDYIKYRIDRAKETYTDANFLYQRGSYNSCINRLYYAAFYAVIALLLKNNIETKSHNGVKQQFGKHFILTEKIPYELGKAYSILFDYRHKGDYDDLFNIEKEIVDKLLEPVKQLIQKIGELIDE